jgi:hypothetical protein
MLRSFAALTAQYQGTENASCPIALDGMEQCRPIHGETTLQALLLAIRFLGMRLHDFLSRGGRVVYADDNAGGDDVEVALDALFGALPRDAPPGASS